MPASGAEHLGGEVAVEHRAMLAAASATPAGRTSGTVGRREGAWYRPATVHRHRLVPFAIALASLAVACSSEPETPPPSPTPFFTSGSPTATTGTITGATGGVATGPTATGGPTGDSAALPTTDPGAGTGNIRRGSVTIRVSGDLRVTKTLRQMISTVYAPPPGGMALVWTAGGTDPTTVGFGGISFVGTEPTAPTLTVTITVPSSDTGFETYVSFDGECDVTIETATDDAIRGGLRCDGLSTAGGPTVDVTATFSASG